MIFIIGVLIFGRADCCKNTLFGKLYRFFAERFPKYIENKARKIFRMRPAEEDVYQSDCAGKGGPCRYFVITGFAIMYAVLVYDYFKNTYSFIPLLHSNVLTHRILSYVLPSIPWIIVIALIFMDPGVINAENVEGYLKKYPYDHIVYKEKLCPTGKIPVVARSRYCGYTNRRVAKYDHYCPWVIQTIGERNHRFFILFLVACVVASTYYCVHDIFVVAIYIQHVYSKIPWGNSVGENILKFIVMLFLIQPLNTSCIILFLIIIVMLIAFIIQQLYYISQNMTTIEITKYDKIEKEIREKRKDNKLYVKNIYDKGLISNWMEFLFPTRVPKGPKWEPDAKWQKIIKEEEKHQKDDKQKYE